MSSCLSLHAGKDRRDPASPLRLPDYVVAHYFRNPSLSSAAVTLLAAALLFCAMGFGAAIQALQAARQNPCGSRGAGCAPVPFRPGETLEYRVLFSKYAVNAAKIETSVIEQRNFFGHLAWHFRAVAHTMDTTRVLFAIDDQFDSYTSAANLFSLQYEMYLHEQGKEQTSLYRMTTDADPAPPDVTALRVAPGTRDAISFLYNLRAADWQRTPELRVPVFDGRRLYDVVARVDTPQGMITVPAGNFPLPHRHPVVRSRQGTHRHAVMALDCQGCGHTPVLVEADIPFGTANRTLHLP